LIILVVGFLGVSCGSRYSHSKCPHSPFPESGEMFKSGDFSSLAYFKVSEKPFLMHEIWADHKFDFDASLRYNYLREDGASDDCVDAITLELKSPLTEERRALGSSFINFFEQYLKADLAPFRTFYTLHAEHPEVWKADSQSVDGLIAGVTKIHHPYRGDFVVMGIYSDHYYEREVLGKQ
jgi:hypothetical protein